MYQDVRASTNFTFINKINSATALELWLLSEKYAGISKKPNLFERIRVRIKYGISYKALYDTSMIIACQKRYYEARISELMNHIAVLEKTLLTFDFDSRLAEYSDLSAKLFQNNLACKYAGRDRKQFELDDLWKNSVEFITEYPVILSTTYSLRSSLSKKVMYDYVIIDESSQVDIATGALALSCARKAVVVGDLRQLPNVVDREASKITDEIFSRFSLPEPYRYRNHSLLSAIIELFPYAPRTLLREHYRCHPKIIGFCNQKFYKNELIVLTEARSNRQPLVVYQTAEGNHAREHMNQRQIDVIMQEVIPQQQLDIENGSLGIVTPYRNQTNALQLAFKGTAVKADTVDKFQGRENDVVILSTVDNEVGEFADNANRLNVAVSRAIEQLIVVVSAADIESDTNIGDLVRYIQYNNVEILQSEVYSIFDYLYSAYSEKRAALFKNNKRVSEYDSENLMFLLINDILKQEQFAKYAVALHVPLKQIIRDVGKLNYAEMRYAMNDWTHVDFLVFDKLGKVPRFVVEVDGVKYHKEGTRQHERDIMKDGILKKYNLPYGRFKTNESNERKRLIDFFNERL
jgi:hypothetical protein